MTQSVQQVISECKLIFPDAPNQILLDSINRTHRDLCAEFPIYQQVINVSLVSGQQTYTLGIDVMSIRQATYINGPNLSNYRILEAVDIADLDRTNRAWRRFPYSSTRQYYIDAGTFGTIPASDLTTAGSPPSGFPYVELQCTTYTDLQITDLTPAVLRSSQIYKDGACLWYSQIEKPEMTQYFQMAYDKEFMNIERTLGRRNSLVRHRVYPDSTGMAFVT